MLLLLSTALCMRFLFHRADHLPGRVRHVFASPAWPLGPHGLGRRGNETPPPCCRGARSAAISADATRPAFAATATAFDGAWTSPHEQPA